MKKIQLPIGPFFLRCSLQVSALCRSIQKDSGNSLVELALILSLFGTPLLLGTAQAAILIYDSIEISNAAHVATLYGMQGLIYASDTSHMIAAAQAEASDFTASLTVTPTTYFACSAAIGGTQFTGANAQSDAASACSGGSNHPLQFVQVTTQKSITSFIHFAGLPSTVTLTGFSVMEVEE
jgi:Flp pilus assembly protein TadG